MYRIICVIVQAQYDVSVKSIKPSVIGIFSLLYILVLDKYNKRPQKTVNNTDIINSIPDLLFGFIIAIDPKSSIPNPRKNTKYSIRVSANINAVNDPKIRDAIADKIILL
jgi:hypothetical protein